jgi:hypothetical protein
LNQKLEILTLFFTGNFSCGIWLAKISRYLNRYLSRIFFISVWVNISAVFTLQVRPQKNILQFMDLCTETKLGRLIQKRKDK